MTWFLREYAPIQGTEVYKSRRMGSDFADLGEYCGEQDWPAPSESLGGN